MVNLAGPTSHWVLRSYNNAVLTCRPTARLLLLIRWACGPLEWSPLQSDDRFLLRVRQNCFRHEMCSCVTFLRTIMHCII